ncbi:PREDICTED: uncharacterized protein LOC106314770 [Brassica oleracea var. oleracea]|uniref:uncharacterized protein LOC106314770 n=1 Tax=Brassica oleracea var. oleracea TaxID=109376 RepID=UPI0006A726CE|nr:PREDICTED: uncharacterized protein LOC106314770 [Brassica oleracea var. oleracea]
MASNKKRRFQTQVRPILTLETPNSETGANFPTTAPGGDASTREKAKDAQTYDMEDRDSEPEHDKEASDGAARAESPMIAHLHQMFSERLDAMQSMVQRLLGVAPPIRKSNPDSYADTPFTNEITLIEMPMKFSFRSIKAYDSTTDLDDHVAQYRQRMLAIALRKGSREATLCKGFGSTLTGPALQWYINLPSSSIASFAVLSDNIPTAISAFKRGLLPDRDLYKELTKYHCKTMEDVLSRAWAQEKWEEDVTSRAKEQQKQDSKTIRSDRTERDEKPSQRPATDSGNRNRGRYQNRPIEKAEGMAVSAWLDISHLSVSRPKLVNVLRQMGQEVKWSQKMKAPDSFWNPGLWCDFHRDHGHKTEDCVALNIEVNELLRKGHLRKLLSEKAKSHIRKETMEISGISHAGVKKSTWNAKHGLEAAKPKRLLLGTDEISFAAKEQEKVLTPHHDALVISLTVANCLAAYKDLGLEESALTRRITPLIGLSGEVKETAGEITLPLYAEGINRSAKFLLVDCDSSYNMILGRPWIHGMGPVPSTFTKW